MQLVLGGTSGMLGLALVAFGTVFWSGGNLAGEVRFGDELELWREGRLAEGTLTDVDERHHSHRGQDSTRLRFGFVFVAEDGVAREGLSWGGYDDFTRLFGHGRRAYPNEGDRVRVSYLRERPDVSKIAGTWLQPQSPLILVGVLLVTVLPGLAAAGAGALKGRRQVRLLARGHVTEAKLERVERPETRGNTTQVLTLRYVFRGEAGPASIDVRVRANDREKREAFGFLDARHAPAGANPATFAAAQEKLREQPRQVLYAPERPSVGALVDDLPARMKVGWDGTLTTAGWGWMWTQLLAFAAVAGLVAAVLVVV